MTLIGHKICKLERRIDDIFHLKRIQCRHCDSFEIKEVEDEIFGGKPKKQGHCKRFKHSPRKWQYCDYFNKMPKPKNEGIETTCKNCSFLVKSVEISKKTFSKKERSVKWLCSNRDYHNCIPEKMWTDFDETFKKKTVFDKVPKVKSCCEFKTNKLRRFINNYRIWRN